MLTKEQIEKINKEAPNEWQENEQGIFTEPFGIPDEIKEPVVYMRWKIGEVSGGSCWDSSNPQYYGNDSGCPDFKVLDLVIKEINPNISYLKYKEIEELIQSSEETEYEYYGNRTDFEMKFVILSELIEKLKCV